MTLHPLALSAGSSDAHVVAIRSVVSSVWHDLWQAATTSPWLTIVAMVPLVAVLVGCTRVSMRRG